jgi:polysaccharide export outer membrane protein
LNHLRFKLAGAFQKLHWVRFFSCFLGISAILCVSSCVNTKNLNYFKDIPDETIKSSGPVPEPIIQTHDLLSIIVSSSNPEASAVFNSPNESTMPTSQAANTANTLTIGYMVNQSGDIQFPILGQIHAAGLTKYQLASDLTRQLREKKLLIDPIVTIRYLNFRVSVMGEVNKPGVYSTPIEKLTILEALSFAGDATIYGQKNNVILIRENEKGDKIVQHIDLTQTGIFSSPYFYLRSNDVIIVQTDVRKITKERNAALVPIILSLVSLTIVILNYTHWY